MADLTYPYPELWAGTLLKRYKRFFADVQLATGEILTAHCANTGPMTGICQEGAQVYVSLSPNPNRKLPYSWEIIYVDDTWVGINTSLPNRAVGYYLEQRLFPELSPYQTIQREVAYGCEKSRIDFLLQGETNCYVEVKNTTWTKPTAQGRVAVFPDTVTTRGQKHLRELTLLAQQGTRAAIIYFVNRGDCVAFSPGDGPDPEYGQLLRQAIAAGVLVLPYKFDVSPQGLTLQGRLPVLLE